MFGVVYNKIILEEAKIGCECEGQGRVMRGSFDRVFPWGLLTGYLVSCVVSVTGSAVSMHGIVCGCFGCVVVVFLGLHVFPSWE